eukprot:scaffold45006_cov29-Tisochrysis_lutea.AAC.9
MKPCSTAVVKCAPRARLKPRLGPRLPHRLRALRAARGGFTARLERAHPALPIRWEENSSSHPSSLFPTAPEGRCS